MLSIPITKNARRLPQGPPHLASNNLDRKRRGSVGIAALCLGISFLIAPSLGASVGRMLSDSWPISILAIPIIATSHLDLRKFSWATVLFSQFVISWFGMMSNGTAPWIKGSNVLSFSITIGIWGYS